MILAVMNAILAVASEKFRASTGSSMNE